MADDEAKEKLIQRKITDFIAMDDLVTEIELSVKATEYRRAVIDTIVRNNLFDVLSIFAFYRGCSRATFYNNGLDKLDSIKRAIDDNKIVTKHSLKAKWAKSDNPTLQIALFKTIATPEEREAMAMNYHDHRSKGERMNGAPITPANIQDASDKLDQKYTNDGEGADKD